MGVANKQAASPSKDTIAQAMIVIPQPEASAILSPIKTSSPTLTQGTAGAHQLILGIRGTDDKALYLKTTGFHLAPHLHILGAQGIHVLLHASDTFPDDMLLFQIQLLHA